MISLKDNFMWFGVVENTFDPTEQGRVQVRVIGIHTENKSLLPTEDLPWCDVAQSINNPFISGKGGTPVGLVNGACVSGLFRDPGSFQDPVVLFTFGGARNIFLNNQAGYNDPDDQYPRPEYGNDVNVLARGKVTGKYDPTANASSNQAEPATSDINAVEQKPVDPAVLKKTPWMPVAMGLVGVNERDNPQQVREFHKYGGGINANEDTPWCASYVNYCFYKANVKGSRSAAVRSFLNWGTSVKGQPGGVPYGAVAVMRGSRGPSSGHVAFVTKDLGNGRYECVGGNQSGDSSGKRFDDGGRCTIQIFKEDKIIDFRFPA